MEDKSHIKKAIAVLLKRYDLIRAWYFVFPAWLVDIIFSMIFSVFILWFVLSVFVFLAFDIVWGINQYLICLFSIHPFEILFGLFLIVFISRVICNYFSKLRNKKIYIKNDFTFENPENSTNRIFDFNIFLPRLIITIAYVWVTFVFTEESFNYLSTLEENLYMIAFLIGLVGSVLLLFYDARQNAPSVKKRIILWNRVIPILAYSVFISVLIGLFFEYSGDKNKNNYSHTDESYFFKDEIQKANNSLAALEDLERMITSIKNDWYELPDIPNEAASKRKACLYQYSEEYNLRLGYIKSNMGNYNSLLDKFTKNQNICVEISHINKLYFDTVPKVNQRNNSMLSNQVKIYHKNNNKFLIELRKQDSLLFILTNQFSYRLDSLNSNGKESMVILHRVSGYDFLNSKGSTGCKCFFGMKKDSLFNEHKINSILFLTDYPIQIPKWINNIDNKPFSFNLKRFLIQVVLAVSIWVIGQSILGERTVKE